MCLGTGIFGYGFAEMARKINAKVEIVSYEYDETCSDVEPFKEVLARTKPTLVIAVHCETPSGTLNPLKEVGKLWRFWCWHPREGSAVYPLQFSCILFIFYLMYIFC